MESNYHLELATKYLKIQERQRQASKKKMRKNKERLIKLNLDKINEIKTTDEYKEKKARWNQVTLAKTKATRDIARAANPNARPRGRPLKTPLIDHSSNETSSAEYSSNDTETTSESLGDVLKRYPYRPEEIVIL